MADESRQRKQSINRPMDPPIRAKKLTWGDQKLKSTPSEI